MRIDDIEYTAEGRQLVGRLHVDDSTPGRRPGVLVCHDFLGLRDHTSDIAARLAGLGFAAFALDYHGGGTVLPPDEVGPRFGELANDIDQVRRLANAGLDVLRASDVVDTGRLAAIGYCFGGTMALELARGGAELRAVVGFHSGLGTPRSDDARNITAKVLVCIGATDPIVPPDQRAAFEQEMTAAGVDWQMHLYGGVGHSFTNPDADGSNPAMKYDQRADEQSWAAMLDHLGRFL